MVQLRPVGEQVVVVFGASSGIGRAAALRFAARGARVVVASRSEEELHRLVQEIEAAGGRGLAVAAEAAEYDQVEAVARHAVAHFGRIDTWVHLAAVSVFGLFSALDPEEFRRITDVNLNGAAYGALAAMRHMAGGALILVSSVEGIVPLPYQSAYAASKHGMHGMIGALRMEIRHQRLPISLTEIMPATINTPFYSKNRSKLGVKVVGVGPIYQPEPVADAIVYAAEHPTRQLIVGGAGKALVLINRFAPGLVEAALQLVAFRLQKTSEPWPAGRPDGLHAHLPGYDRVRGDFSALALPNSAYTWVTTRPPALRAALGAALGLAALVGLRRAGRRG